MTDRIIRVQAHAKINWCLAVTGRDARGYHLLDMLMQRVSLYDTLSAAPGEALSLRIAGDPVGCAPEKNLVLRAARALQAQYGVTRGARLTLVKRIPQGAGMGGGSSDAAAALKALCRLWGLRPEPQALGELALSIGADVPFFLRGTPARVQGIGERLTPAALPGQVPLVLFKLTEGLSTAEVYAESDRCPQPPVRVEALADCLSKRDFVRAQALTGNALYPAALRLQPGLETAKRAVEESGALYSLMTGSGAVVYGVFATSRQALDAAEQLRNDYPGAYAACVMTLS